MTIKFLKKPVQCRNRKCGYAFLPKDRDSLPHDCPKCSKVMWYAKADSNVLTSDFRYRAIDMYLSGAHFSTKEIKKMFPDHAILSKYVDRILVEDGIFTQEHMDMYHEFEEQLESREEKC